MFEPRDHKYEYKVIVTNKSVGPKKVLFFHNGRGSQEGIFGEAKTDCKIEYVPVRSLNGNQLYCIAGMITHNLSREIQIASNKKIRSTNMKRSTLWNFKKTSTLRHSIIQKAAKLVRPQGKLTLIMGVEEQTGAEIRKYLSMI